MITTIRSLALAAISFAATVVSSPVGFSVNPQALARRDLTEVICGLYPSASRDIHYHVIQDLMDKGDLNVPVYAHSCNRVGCYTTSGAYVCNDQDADIDIPMSEIVGHIRYLADVCMSADRGQSPGSGRVTTTDRNGYNVNVGYCNGRDSVDIPPSGYGWPGPNGTPPIQCGKPGQPPCEGTGCIEGSIVMEKQEPVPCGDYLGAGYVGAGAVYIYSSTRNVGTTWSVGAFLSIDTSDLAPVSVQAGFFSSFSETTTTGSSTGISDTCGADDATGSFTCGLHIRPQCFAMSGYCETADTGRVPWANVVPQTSSDGVGVFTSEICTCENCAGADEEAAPSARCGLTCSGCMDTK